MTVSETSNQLVKRTACYVFTYEGSFFMATMHVHLHIKFKYRKFFVYIGANCSNYIFSQQCYRRESISEMEILLDLIVIRILNLKTTFLMGRLCACDYYQHNYTRNFKFGRLNFNDMNILETFYESQTNNLYARKRILTYNRIRKHYDLWMEFHVSAF